MHQQLGNATPSRRGADILTIGLGTTVLMWAIAYGSLLQPGLVLGELLFGLIILCAGVGGVAVVKLAHRGVMAAALAGLVCGLLNLLLVGSIVAGEKPGEFIADAWLWGAGSLVGPVVMFMVGAVIGGAVGGTARLSTGAAQSWPSRFVLVAATAVLLLITTGGLVTTLGAGLAVPDWPNSFGHNMLLFPLAKMDHDTGVYHEHAHRLYGMLVGVTGIMLAVCMFLWDRRALVRVLGVMILALICVQGYMGGMRVTENSLLLAIVHGFNAQLILGLVLALAMMLTVTWKNAGPARPTPGAGFDRGLSMALTAGLAIQVLLGAFYRHMQAAEEPSMGALMGLRHGHAFLGSLMIVVLVLAVSMRAVSVNNDVLPVKRVGKALLHTMILQVVLGVAAFLVVPSNPRPVTEAVPMLETVLATAHQVVGSLFMALAIVNLFWVHRLLVKSATASPSVQPSAA